MDYLEYFGLSSEPFSNAPLSRFYFASRQHSEALSRLMYAASSMKGLAICIGDIGHGKTTLARRMLDALPESEYEAAMLVIVHAGITPNWLLKRIASQLGVAQPADDKLTILSQLYQRLLELYQAGKRAVVLIDEAQMLATRELMEEFRGLLNLEVPERKLITFIFFGLPEIERNLRLDPPLAQRIALRYQLKPLSHDDTRAYIEHRLKIAGGESSLLPSDVVQEIHSYTAGVPRLINTLCDNLLLEMFFARRQSADLALLREVAHNLAIDRPPEPPPTEQPLVEEQLAVEGSAGHDAVVYVERGTTSAEAVFDLASAVVPSVAADVAFSPAPELAYALAAQDAYSSDPEPAPVTEPALSLAPAPPLELASELPTAELAIEASEPVEPSEPLVLPASDDAYASAAPTVAVGVLDVRVAAALSPGEVPETVGALPADPLAPAFDDEPLAAVGGMGAMETPARVESSADVEVLVDEPVAPGQEAAPEEELDYLDIEVVEEGAALGLGAAGKGDAFAGDGDEVVLSPIMATSASEILPPPREAPTVLQLEVATREDEPLAPFSELPTAEMGQLATPVATSAVFAEAATATTPTLTSPAQPTPAIPESLPVALETANVEGAAGVPPVVSPAPAVAATPSVPSAPRPARTTSGKKIDLAEIDNLLADLNKLTSKRV